MKNVLKKGLAMLLVLMMVVSLGACGAESEDKSTDSSSKSTESSKSDTTKKEDTKEADKKADEIIEIDMWNISTAGDEKVNDAVMNAIATIESERPDIKINLSQADGDAYKTKIKTAAAANELPDIFYTWLPGYSKGFVDAGSILKLDDYLSDDAKANVNMAAVMSGNGAYDGIYALPVEVKMAVMYVNETLFKEHDIKVPQTYEELLTAVEAFNEVGIKAIVAPGKRIWPVMMFYDILAVQTVGAEGAIGALKKETSFDQQGFMDAALKMEELVNAGAFVEGGVGLDNPEADAEFMNGNVPMYFMGSWAASNFSKEENPVAAGLRVQKFPALGQGFDNVMLGGTGDGYMVSNNSEHKEDAVWVVERFTKLLCESDTTLFPVWNVEKDFSDMPQAFQDMSDVYNTSEGFVIWWDTYMNGDDAQTHKNLALELYAGLKTPQEYMDGMKVISDN